MIPPNFFNCLMNACCLKILKLLAADSIDLIVTSPPYGKIRDYGGHRFEFEPIARELWRVIKPGGIVCWHVQDQIVDGSLSLESFRQALFFKKLGFKIHQIIIVDAGRAFKHRSRFGNAPQFAFVLSKGKPSTVNHGLHKPNLHAGHLTSFGGREKDGIRKQSQVKRIAPFGIRSEIWSYPSGSHNASDELASKHPATMPEKLAEDLIRAFSNEGELVLDPMSGSGTTAKIALLNNRRFLGTEIHEKYHQIATERLQATISQIEREQAEKPWRRPK